MKTIGLLLSVAFTTTSWARVCLPEGHPLPDNPYAYIRAETKALQWMRDALVESERIQVPTPTDPEGMHKAVDMYTIAEAVSDDYACAATILTNYKDSKNEYVQQSAQTLLEAIKTTKEINADLISMMESLYKATKAEDID